MDMCCASCVDGVAAEGGGVPGGATEPAMHAVWFPVESLSLLSCCGVALSSHGRAQKFT